MPGLMQWIREVDIDILRHINPAKATAWIPFFQFISNTALFVDFGVPVCIFIVALIQRRKRLAVRSAAVLVMIFVVNIISLLMKACLHRMRPYDAYKDLILYTDGGNYSFPSGHTIKA